MNNYKRIFSQRLLAGLIGLLVSMVPFNSIAESENVQIDNVKLIIPLPKGFYKASQADIEEANNPSMPTEVLTIFIPNENSKYEEYGVERDINMQIPKAAKNENISHKEFESVKLSIKNMTEQFMMESKINAEVTAQEILDKYSEDSPEKLDIDIGIGEIRKLGIFAEGENHIGHSFLMPVSAQIGNIDKTVLLVQSQVMQYIKGKLIALNSTSEYRSSQDLIWTQEILTDWRKQLVNAN